MCRSVLPLHTNRMRGPLPLSLKLAVAIVGGATVLLAIRQLQRDDAIASLRRDIHEVTLILGGDGGPDEVASRPPPPPSVLVVGFRAHGKSSFINTTCRALATETGPLLLRAEAAPPGSSAGTVAQCAVRAMVAADSREEDAEFVMIDTPPLSEVGRLTRADVVAAIGGGGVASVAECVVLVLRCGVPAKERNMAVSRLADIVEPIRERGLHLIVVLTQKRAMRTVRQAEELRREVAFRARTDCVYFIENYTSSNAINFGHPPAVRNDFETHFTVLTIIRQCLEFIKLRRGHLALGTSASRRPGSGVPLMTDVCSAGRQT